MSLQVRVYTNSEALLDAVEDVCFSLGRPQTGRDVAAFVNEAREILDRWQSEANAEAAKRAAARARYELERAAKAAVDNAPRVGQEAAK